MKKIPKVINGNSLVKLLGERFEKEAKYDTWREHWKAKRLYIKFMLGEYKPKRLKEWEGWEDFYKNNSSYRDERGK